MRGVDVLNAAQVEADRVTAELLKRLPHPRRGVSRKAVERLSDILAAYARESRVESPTEGDRLAKGAADKAASMAKDTVVNVGKDASKNALLLGSGRSSEKALEHAIAATLGGRADDRILTARDIAKRTFDAKSGPLAFKSLGKDFALGVVYNYLEKHPDDRLAVLGFLLEGGVTVATSASGGPVAIAFMLAFVVHKAVNELGERWVRSVEREHERRSNDTVLQSYLKIHAKTGADLDREIQMLERATIAGTLDHDTTYFKRGFAEMGKLLVMQHDGSAALNDFTRQEAARLEHNLYVFLALTIKRFAYAAAAAWMAEQTSLVMARHYGEASQLCAELADTPSVARAHEALTERMNRMLRSPGYDGVVKLRERSNIFRSWSRDYDSYRDRFIALRLKILDDLNIFTIMVAEVAGEAGA